MVFFLNRLLSATFLCTVCREPSVAACECLLTADEICLSAGRDSLTTCVLTFSCDFVTGSLVLLDCGCSFVTVTGRSLTFCSGFEAAACESDFTGTGVVAGRSCTGAARFVADPLLCRSLYFDSCLSCALSTIGRCGFCFSDCGCFDTDFFIYNSTFLKWIAFPVVWLDKLLCTSDFDESFFWLMLSDKAGGLLLPPL